jgi:hypothetical protein
MKVWEIRESRKKNMIPGGRQAFLVAALYMSCG